MTAFALAFLLITGDVYIGAPIPTEARCWQQSRIAYAGMYRVHAASRMSAKILAPNGIQVARGWSVACITVEVGEQPYSGPCEMEGA